MKSARILKKKIGGKTEVLPQLRVKGKRNPQKQPGKPQQK